MNTTETVLAARAHYLIEDRVRSTRHLLPTRRRRRRRTVRRHRWL